MLETNWIKIERIIGHKGQCPPVHEIQGTVSPVFVGSHPVCRRIPGTTKGTWVRVEDLRVGDDILSTVISAPIEVTP